MPSVNIPGLNVNVDVPQAGANTVQSPLGGAFNVNVPPPQAAPAAPPPTTSPDMAATRRAVAQRLAGMGLRKVQPTAAPQPTRRVASERMAMPVDPQDNTKLYLMVGGGVLLVGGLAWLLLRKH